MNIIIKRAYKRIMTPVYKIETMIAKKFAAHAYKYLYLSEWCVDNPEQFDHEIDLYYQWPVNNQVHWLERGVFNLLAIKQFKNPVSIELCCGDGFNATRFYASSCSKIWACDFDEKVIKEARHKYKAENVKFEVADIRNDIPMKVCGFPPTNIIWDTAIAHFTPNEIEKIMNRLCRILQQEKGILSGHTIVEKSNGEKQLEQNKYEFKDKEDLKRFFTPYFKNVIVWETEYENRHNLYFMASDGILPFTNNWDKWTTTFETIKER